jgi:CRP-like cAMP-binding protein
MVVLMDSELEPEIEGVDDDLVTITVRAPRRLKDQFEEACRQSPRFRRKMNPAFLYFMESFVKEVLLSEPRQRALDSPDLSDLTPDQLENVKPALVSVRYPQLNAFTRIISGMLQTTARAGQYLLPR